MNCGNFERECRGLGKALIMTADEVLASGSNLSEPLQYQAAAASVMVIALRSLADAIEEAAK